MGGCHEHGLGRNDGYGWGKTQHGAKVTNGPTFKSGGGGGGGGKGCGCKN